MSTDQKPAAGPPRLFFTAADFVYESEYPNGSKTYTCPTHAKEFSDRANRKLKEVYAYADELKRERDQLRKELTEAAEMIDVWKSRYEINGKQVVKWREQAAKFYSTIRNLFCDPEGNPSFMGSAGDKKILRDLLTEYAKAGEGKSDQSTDPRLQLITWS